MTALKNLEDLIFVDDKLPTKTKKITSLKNLYAFSTDWSLECTSNNTVLTCVEIKLGQLKWPNGCYMLDWSILCFG